MMTTFQLMVLSTTIAINLISKVRGLNRFRLFIIATVRKLTPISGDGRKLISIGSGELENANQDELYRIVSSIHRRGVKVHYLGCTEYEKMAYIPVYSADSTTWNRKGASGRIHYWNPLSLKVNKTDVIALDHKVPNQSVKYHIRTYKFRPQLEEYLWNELELTTDDLIRGERRYIYRAVVKRVNSISFRLSASDIADTLITGRASEEVSESKAVNCRASSIS